MEYNNKYTNFMDKLDTDDKVKRELIEKLKKEENRKGEIGMKIRNKIIAVISALSVISIGGVAFANTMPEEWKNSIKAFFGIISNETYEEIKVETNETKYDNGYSLTLENYGIDRDNLLLEFNLKTEKEIELEYPFMEEPTYYFYDRVKIVNENQDEYVITNEIINGEDNAKSTILLDKINSKEYKIYEIYSIGNKKISNNSTLNIDFLLEELPKDADELIYDELANFKFEIQIDNEKMDDYYEEFDIEDKEIRIKDEFLGENNEIFTGDAIFSIKNFKTSNIASKFIISLYGYYHTNTQYTVKITDENDNIILNRNIQYLLGGMEEDIIIPKIDMNSKIKITIYEFYYGDTEDIAEGSIEIDLSEITK